MYIFLRMHMPRSEKEVFAMRMSRSEKEVFAMWSLRIDSEVCRVCRDFGLWSRMLGVCESVRDLVSDLGSLWGSWSRESVRDLRGDICLEREKNLWRDFVFISTPTNSPWDGLTLLLYYYLDDLIFDLVLWFADLLVSTSSWISIICNISRATTNREIIPAFIQ